MTKKAQFIFNIVAKLKLMSKTPMEIINTIRADFWNKFAEIAQMCEKISTTRIIANLFVNGVQDVELISSIGDALMTETRYATLNLLELKKYGAYYLKMPQNYRKTSEK